MMIRLLTALTALLAVAATAHAQEQETIVFGVVATEQSENVLHLWEPFVEDMSRDTGFHVELRSATDYAGVIEAMRADQVQVAWLTNASGLEASRRADAEVFAKFIYPDGQLGYRSIIIVPAESGLQNVEDLVVCDGTLNFGLGDPLSTSGTLVPQAYIFADRGIDPQTGHYFDDTKRYIDACALSDEQKQQVFCGNARKVFPRLDARLQEVGLL